MYRKLFVGDDAAMEHFLANICTSAWNSLQDAGRSFAEGGALLKAEFPEHAQMIDAWFERHGEMVAGAISGTVDILAELRDSNVPLYALSNWSSETFPTARNRFDFLQWFRGILLSGEVRLIKPDPRIFQLFLETFGIDPSRAVYIDDLLPNVEAARAVGMKSILFKEPAKLRIELIELGLLRSANTGADGEDDPGENITPIRSSPEV